MVTTIGSFVPAEYTVWAIAGAIFVTGGLDFFFSFRTSREEGPSTRDPRRRPPRVLTFLAVAFWGASLILPLNVLWGPGSVVAGTSVTEWTSQGWMCRIFLTLCLGVCAPLALTLVAVMLFSMMYEMDTRGFDGKGSSLVLDHPLAIGMLIALPFCATQAVIAWISLSLTWEDMPIEESPSSFIAKWLAPFVIGNELTCNSAGLDGLYPCTACVFPAASVLVHGVWTLLFVLALVYVTFKLRPQRARTYWLTGSLLASTVAGIVCMGVAIMYHDPFTWINQGLWLGWVSTVLVAAAAISYAA
jgi:hypothetical protein